MTLQNFDGLLLLNKEPGPSSHDLVQIIRKKWKIKQVGHAGTLDPMASGLMILLLGKATRLSSDLSSLEKAYHLTVHFGIRTDTFDREGTVLSKESVSLDPEEIRLQSQKLMGKQEFPVPLFSATKVKGRKLYQYARSREEVKLPIKEMKFYDLNILRVKEDLLECEFHCSKGSYVRSWVHELGENLGCGAVLEELSRKKSGPYFLHEALKMKDLNLNWKTKETSQGEKSRNAEEGKSKPLWTKEKELFLSSALIPLENIFPHWKKVRVNGRDEKLMIHGQISHPLKRRLVCERKEADRTGKKVGIKVFSERKDSLLSVLVAEPKKGVKIKACFAKI